MSEKVKILRILNRFNLGGPVYNASYLSKYLEDDFETLLIGGQKLDDEEDALFIPQSLGIKPIVVPEMKRSLGLINEYKAYLKIKEIIKEFQPDIVHTHASKAGALGRMAAYNSGVKHIVHTYHGHVFEHYFGPAKTWIVKVVERFLGKRSEAIIAISQKQKDDLVHRFKIAENKKFHIIPLGFNLRRFTKNEDIFRSSFREKYALSEDDIAIGIIGRLAPIKNHELFLRGFARLKKSVPNAVAFIIGDGNMKSDLQQLCLDLGLNNGSPSDVIFTSWIKNVEDVVHGLDIVCLTSLNEGTPVSLIEAQASGKPVISSDVGGVSDVVTNKSALLFKSNDEEDFVNNLERLATNGELRDSMGLEGSKWVLDRFSAERLANDTKKLYLELLKN